MRNTIIFRLVNLVIWLGALLLLAYLQFSFTTYAGTDSYYHSKISLLMAKQWPSLIEFPWLPKTVLAPEAFVDHHFLFHYFLAPFVSVDLLNGAKLAATILAFFVFLSFQLCLPKLRISQLLPITLLFFAISPGFLYRMLMIRAQSLSLVILFILLYATLNRRYLLLAISCFVYVWSYNAFPLIGVVVGSYFTANYLTSRSIEWKCLLVSAASICAAMIINPYFPKNFIFLYHHLVDKFSIGGYAVSVGNEWYPYAADKFMIHASIPLSLMIISIAIGVSAKIEEDRKPLLLTLFLITSCFLAMLLKSRRFIELFPPFALLYFIWSVHSLEDIKQKVTKVAFLGPLLTSILISALLFYSVQTTKQSLKRSAPYAKLAPAAAWLRLNTPEHSLVFTSDWDDFTRLFHYNHHNVYLAGLDPYFFYARDPRGFLIWKDITNGRVEGLVGRIIKKRFGSNFVLVDRKKSKMIKLLKEDSQLQQVFQDADSLIFRVNLKP